MSDTFSKRDGARKSTLGPYKATKLWNDLIRAFRSGMPAGKHWRHMKSYDECFSASEAVSWLLAHLQGNPNFGPNVTRQQTVMLLAKFHKIRIFEDVRSTKHNKGEFTDGGRLFRFVNENSPMKSRTASRIPLSTRTSLMNSASSPDIPLSKSSENDLTEKSQLHNKKTRTKSFKMTKNTKSVCKIPSSSIEVEESEVIKEDEKLTSFELENIWKTTVLSRLKFVLRAANIEDIIHSEEIQTQYIIHNVTQINKNGIVTNIDRKDQLPKWVLSAMRCLAYWPERVEELPYYEGFEKDVFTVVKDYFESILEPLTTYNMYIVFTSVMAVLEELDQIDLPPPLLLPQSNLNSPGGLSDARMNSFTSLENLMADLTMNAPSSALVEHPSDVLIVNDPDTIPNSSGTYINMPDVVSTHSGLGGPRNVKRFNSTSSLPGAKLETSFGLNGAEPETRLIVKQISPTYLQRSHNTMGTPDSGMSQGSSNSRLGFGREQQFNEVPASREGGSSRASVRSVGFLRNSKVSFKYHPSTFVTHYSKFLEKSHRTTSVSTLQSSVDENSPVESGSSPEYNIKSSTSSSDNNNADKFIEDSDKPPRTCPQGGTYNQFNHVTKSCVSLLNNVISRSIVTPEYTISDREIFPMNKTPQNSVMEFESGFGPGYVAASQSNFSNHVGSSNASKYPHADCKQYVGFAASDLYQQKATTSNTSASSYDTACSHLSSNLSNNAPSTNRSSVSSVFSSGVSCPRESVSSSVFSSVDVKPRTPNFDSLNRHSSCEGFQARPSPLLEDYNGYPIVQRDGSKREKAKRKEKVKSAAQKFSSTRIPPPVSNLQESYRLAVGGEKSLGTPKGQSLFGKASGLRKSESSPNLKNLTTTEPKNRTLEALQVCCLFLPPANRRKLHLLLRLMHKMANNKELQLSSEKPTRNLVLETFSRCILRSSEEVDFNEILSIQIVSFMMDNYTELMRLPVDFKDQVENQISYYRKNKNPVVHSLCKGSTKDVIASGISYCQQMSLQAYESTKMSSSHGALAELLENIVRDKTMSSKEKKKRIKQFQKHYPDIYSNRFPTSESEAELFPNKPRIKPPLFARPLHKLRNLRL